jgi:hypothetical protein
MILALAMISSCISSKRKKKKDNQNQNFCASKAIIKLGASGSCPQA